MKPNIYCHNTPPDWHNPHKLQLCISHSKLAELAAIPHDEEHIKQGIVAFDHISREWYAIRHFPCFIDSFDCCCAAQAKQLSHKNEKHNWEDIEFPERDDE